MFAVETNDLDATVALFISNTSPEFDVFPEAANPGVKSFVIIFIIVLTFYQMTNSVSSAVFL